MFDPIIVSNITDDEILDEMSNAQASSSSSGVDIKNPYAGARVNALNNHWQPQMFSGNRAYRESYYLLHARIRDLCRNDAIMSRAKKTLQRLVIGSGLQSYSNASLLEPDSEQLINFETVADRWFERWMLDEAAAHGEESFGQLQRTAFGDEVETGNVLWLRVINNDPERSVPLSYELIEWEQVDVSKDRDAFTSRNVRGRKYNRIDNGIEYDSRGRKVAFWLYRDHPYDSRGYQGTLSSESVRIPAERIIHEYISPRPSQRINVSWFATIAQPNKDLDRFVANDLTSRAIQALMAVAVKSDSQNRATGLTDIDPDTGVKNFQLGYPHIGHLSTRDSVEVVESKRSTGDNTPLQNLIINLHSMGIDVSLSTLVGDPSKSNLATIKAAKQDDDDAMAPIQDNLNQRVLRRIRKEHMKWAFARGLFAGTGFTARDYEMNPWRFNEFMLVPSGRADLDKDDGEAAIDRLRSGLSTYQRECARRGLPWRRNILAMRQVNQFAADNQVMLDWTKGQGSVPDSTTSIAGDEKEATAADV